MTRWLVANETANNIVSNEYVYALFRCATFNWPQILVALLDRGVNVNSVVNSKDTVSPQMDVSPHNGKTALHGALEQNNIEAINVLMERGADVNIGYRRSQPSLPLGVAVEAAAPLHVFDRPLVDGADFKLVGNRYAFFRICASGRPDVLRRMLAHGALPDTDPAVDASGQHSPLVEAVYSMSEAVLTQLHSRSVADGITKDAARLSIRCHVEARLETVRLLVEAGARIDDTRPPVEPIVADILISAFSPLMGRHDAATYLMKAGAGPRTISAVMDALRSSRPLASSDRLARQLVRAGYVVGRSTIADLRQRPAGGAAVDRYVAILADEAGKPPPLQRIVRTAIRNQLSTATGGRSIFPVIDHLQLPVEIHRYLKLEGRFHDVETTRFN